MDRVPYAFGDIDVDIAVDRAPGRGSRPDLWPSVGEYPCYDPFLYHRMTHDSSRNRAFRQALRPLAAGRRVLDIGTGQDLHWALEAARAGADRVVAVEAIPECYERAAALLAGLPEAAVIDLRHGYSFDLELEPRAEVCVAELIGSIGSAEGMLAAIADARDRLLTAGAPVVPAACRTMAGAVSLRAMLGGEEPAFSWDSLPYLVEIFELYGRPFDVRLTVANPDPDSVVSTVAAVETLRFDGSTAPDGAADVRLTMRHAGEIDGLLCWVQVTAGPATPVIDSLRLATSWAPAYFPLFDRPAPVSAGDVLAVWFQRRNSDDRVHPDYLVDARLHTAGETVAGSCRSDHHGAALGSAALYRNLFSRG